MARSVRLMVEFARPDRLFVIVKACPQCGAAPGLDCKTNSGAARDFHTDRLALALGYTPINRGSVYRRI